MSNGKSKWTPEEDALFKEGILKYGIQWEEVKKHMRHQRSIDSMIKRWHVKIKYQDAFQKIRNANQGRMKVPEKEQSKEEEAEASESNSGKQQVWRQPWSDQDDKKAKLLVVESGILDWDELAKHMERDVDDIKVRWKKVIYPTLIKSPSEKDYVPKWSLLQDKILSIGQKAQIDWDNDTRFFLPVRTFGSIKARWRRIKEHYSIKQNSRSKYYLIRECLRNIAKRQKLSEENKVQSEEEKQE